MGFIHLDRMGLYKPLLWNTKFFCHFTGLNYKIVCSEHKRKLVYKFGNYKILVQKGRFLLWPFQLFLHNFGTTSRYT